MLRERTLGVELLVIVTALSAGAIGRVVEGALLIVVFAAPRALRSWLRARNLDTAAEPREQAAPAEVRAPSFVQKIERRYSLGMVVATPTLFVVALLMGHGFEAALLRAVTFMVVASPCVLLLSTAPPLLAGIANTGRHGILIASTRVMDQLATIGAVVLGKAGALTEGVPTLVASVSMGDAWTDDDVLEIAAAVENRSGHRVARAVVAAARARGLRLVDVVAPAVQPSCGVHAYVDGRWVQVMRADAVLDGREEDAETAAVRMSVELFGSTGDTAVVVVVDGHPVGVLVVRDEPRPGTSAGVAAVSTHLDRAPTMLTGDDHRSAQALGNAVGIWDVRAELVPEAKVEAIVALREHRTVLVVDDGVGGSAVRVAADVGAVVNRGGAGLHGQPVGTAAVDVAMEDLRSLPGVLRLAQRIRRTIIANIIIGGTVVAGLGIWDLLGELDLPLGLAACAGSAVLVGLNGLRLLRSHEDLSIRCVFDRPWQTPGEAGSRHDSHVRLAPTAQVGVPPHHGAGEVRDA